MGVSLLIILGIVVAAVIIVASGFIAYATLLRIARERKRG
jgi:hypothetical protein